MVDINKIEFIEYWAERNKVSKVQAKDSIQQFINTFKSAVTENGKIDIYGFMSAEVVNRAARVCKNPRNQEIIETKDRQLIKLRISPKFKNMLEE